MVTGTSARKEKVAYGLIELPLRALAISNSGWIAGITPDQKAARWRSDRGLQIIPLPEGFAQAENVSINSKGEVAGTMSSADSRQRTAFFFHEGRIVLLPGEQASANGINEAGEIVGQAKIPGANAIGPVLWKSESGEVKIVDLKICCAGMAKAINNHGEVIGDTYDPQGRYHAFAWDASRGARPLRAPGEEFSSSIALNDQGESLVRQTPGGFLVRARTGTIQVDAREATPHSINRDGRVVGSIGSDPEAQRSFLWDKVHGMRDLNSMIPHARGSDEKGSDDSDWIVEVATGINDHGEIVGWGDYRGTENAGFLLRPLAKTLPKTKPLPQAATK